MKEFYFIRHGETDWNLEHRRQGSIDIPLNATGIKQAEDSASLFKDLQVDKIITSPLKRAKQTADILNEVLNVDVVCDKSLVEINFGSSEGQLVSDILKQAEMHPEKYIFDSVFSFPIAKDGEDLYTFYERYKMAVITNLTKYDSKSLLFVGHGGGLLSLQKTFLGDVSGKVKNAVPYHFYQQNNIWKMEEV
jgi:uncharacterized phosphatase